MSRSSPARLLDALATVIREGGWRWYVFGAQAVLAHGAPRLIADRPKDLDDVRSVLRKNRDALDIDGVRELIALVAQALDRSDLVEELEQLWRDAQR